MPRWLIVLAPLVFAGCGDDQVCTLIGCGENTANVSLAGLPRTPVEVTICADGDCHEADIVRLDGATATAALDHELGDRSRLVVEVRRRGRVIARAAAEVPVSVSHPNGPDCPPECRSAGARLDVRSGRLEPA